MAFKRPMARILERSITAGNGPYALSAVDNSYNRFSSFMSIGDTTWATIDEPGVAFWAGTVTYSAANEITLTTVEETKGTFGAGTKEIFAGALAGFDVAYPLDSAGIIGTGGTATAYTATSFRVYDTLTRLNNRVVGFTPHATSGAAPTLNVDGLGAKPLRAAPGADLLPGVLIQGTPYVAIYNHADQAFYLHNFYGNPYNVPLGAGMDYWGTTAPNSAFAFPIGQQISQATYPALYALFGPNRYGSDSGGNFFLPDKTGRVSAMKEATATRLTTGGGGVDGATLGSASSIQSKTLAATNLPSQTPTGAITNGAISTSAVKAANSTTAGPATGGGNSGGYTDSALTVVQGTSTFAGNALPGQNSTPFPIVQPTIICNYIIRVL